MTIQKSHAGQMRSAQTEAERRLWGYLRKRSLAGHRFNRQVSIGPYIVDFLCRERRLIIEVDGATHGDAEALQHDLRRTSYLRSRGYAVFRADNADVFRNLGGVLDGILWALEERPIQFCRRPLNPSDSSPSAAGGA